jgi:hypothetical protein
MKFRLTFKTPDAHLQLSEIMDQDKYNNCLWLMQSYVRYNEYVTLEFDTETHSVKVLSNGN